MSNIIVNAIKEVSKMEKRDRNLLLCKLSVKEFQGILTPLETIQLEFIQTIRKYNGEIDAVLKSWDENPELDPRNENNR